MSLEKKRGSQESKSGPRGARRRERPATPSRRFPWPPFGFLLLHLAYISGRVYRPVFHTISPQATAVRPRYSMPSPPGCMASPKSQTVCRPRLTCSQSRGPAGYHGTSHSLRWCRQSEPFSLSSREQQIIYFVVLPLSHSAQERPVFEVLHSLPPRRGAIPASEHRKSRPGFPLRLFPSLAFRLCPDGGIVSRKKTIKQ